MGALETVTSSHPDAPEATSRDGFAAGAVSWEGVGSSVTLESAGPWGGWAGDAPPSSAGGSSDPVSSEAGSEASPPAPSSTTSKDACEASSAHAICAPMPDRGVESVKTKEKIVEVIACIMSRRLRRDVPGGVLADRAPLLFSIGLSFLPRADWSSALLVYLLAVV